MEQFGRPIAIAVYSQPVTDIPGALLARVAGPVAAYNWVVLLSFPLSAAAAYLLARHLSLAPWPAAAAALAYAFSPFHLAHAAYHPHVAQTQWLPLYLLALWRCLDAASPLSVGLLAAASAGVTLSNFYGGLIAGVITPVAVACYWLVAPGTGVRPARNLAVTAGSLAAIAACGAGYGIYAAGAVVANPAAFAFPRGDLFRYSAKWWGYFVPPAASPWLGGIADRIWTSAGVHEGLLEQQVSLGWGVAALGVVALWCWTRRHAPRQPACLAYVPVLATIAVAALLCSLSPERTIGIFRFVRPSALLYDLLPMFRSYARFGMVVQLMAVLLAAIGVECLRRSGTLRARAAAVALAVIVAGEYAIAPWGMWRDVLPTSAHRWVMRQAAAVLALDCTPLDQESASVPWLTAGRVALLGATTPDCAEPRLAEKLAALGYTHIIVRTDTAAGGRLAHRVAAEGLQATGRFADARLLAVTSAVPAIYTAGVTGWSPREHDADRSWQWMGAAGEWSIVNTTGGAETALLEVEIAAFHRARSLEVRLDGELQQIVVVEPSRRVYRFGPLAVPAGRHSLAFRPSTAATVASDVQPGNDPRPLSFAFGSWRWRRSGPGS
uniref:DUF6311 domain-containing protein n=1 Tax=uncultured Acidobacteriota bacterium TaxID=171953 RepID=Q7X329_9BACT|nr:hypothetical protein [uncultured Acidobacteriota bacterium]